MVKKYVNNANNMTKILVVDDDEGILEAFKILLESEGYEVTTSPDGEELSKLDNNNLPDLVILDVLLSGKDGRVICKHLKENLSTKNIPVIMVSAHPNVEDSVKQSGANDYLKKPFDIEVLLQKIEEHTGNQNSKSPQEASK
jgi:DNA-binding response OmpR family regulator